MGLGSNISRVAGLSCLGIPDALFRIHLSHATPLPNYHLRTITNRGLISIHKQKASPAVPAKHRRAGITIPFTLGVYIVHRTKYYRCSTMTDYHASLSEMQQYRTHPIGFTCALTHARALKSRTLSYTNVAKWRCLRLLFQPACRYVGVVACEPPLPLRLCTSPLHSAEPNFANVDR